MHRQRSFAMGRFLNRRSRATRRRRLPLHTLETLEPRLVLDATVVFNEIMYNPPDDESLEWVELHNQMAVDMDLSGWSIRGIGYDFPDGTILGGGEYLVIAADPEELAAAGGFADAIGPYPGSLSNGGEELELISNSDRRMNRVDYRDSGDWPVAPDGGGTSLSKRNERAASDPAENWTRSTEIGGTPGARNFPDQPDFIVETLIPTGAAARALVPSDGNLATTWTAGGFDDATWTTGTTGVGFDNQTTYGSFGKKCPTC
jgi:hypothetical protein